MANPGDLCDISDELGSASNPIFFIEDEEDCGKQYASGQDYSDGDTEPLSTPEVWANLGDGGFPVPQNKSAVMDSSSVLTPITLLDGQSLGCIRSFEPEPTTCAHLEDEKSEVAERAKGEESTFIRSGKQ
ncbi:uncharacterized protein N7511_008401 [Penicillium nucicola]|uniref:uncharacterized protein n=1 Tax=Penicillium nucicola TaxID=1850975 RepID=UPI002545030D|nr:uncharacterized protein N7511_008401 [Penicillium nucicola]KAJ5751436.1 hypothetical protein N7511_008401 [Penicillium nucicola]